VKALATLALVLVGAIAGVSIYTWGYRSQGPSERTKAVGIGREISVLGSKYGPHKGRRYTLGGSWMLGPGRWLIRLNWPGGWQCSLLDLGDYKVAFDDKGTFNPEGLIVVGDSECLASARNYRS
jgi:hypothetical protein